MAQTKQEEGRSIRSIVQNPFWILVVILAVALPVAFLMIGNHQSGTRDFEQQLKDQSAAMSQLEQRVQQLEKKLAAFEADVDTYVANLRVAIKRLTDNLEKTLGDDPPLAK